MPKNAEGQLTRPLAPQATISAAEVLLLLARAIETQRDRQKCGIFIEDLADRLDPAHLRSLASAQLAPQEDPMISESLFDRLSLHMRTREARGASAEELALLAEARAEIERLRLMRETSQEALRECMAELREAREENLALLAALEGGEA